jgi:FkbM family methyltransferase
MRHCNTRGFRSVIGRAITKVNTRFWFRVFGFVVRNLSKTGVRQSRLVVKTYHYISHKFMGRDEVAVHVHGQTMYVDLAFALTLESAGTYLSERLMTVIFTKHVTEGMTVIDVGAHAGYYTLLAARAVGGKGSVFAFEPEPSNYELLLKNIQLNSHQNVIPVQKAVTNITGPVKLFLAEDASGHSILSDNPHQGAILVDSTTLDDFFASRTQPINIIKIDVEGAEDAVLEGMRRIITENPELTIFTEFSPEALKRAGCLPTEYLKKLTNYGFDIYLIDEKKQSLEPAEVNRVLQECKSIGYVNLLCHRGQKGLL